jgi:hypothetical protein
VTPTATTEAVKSKTLVCNSRRLSVISSLVGNDRYSNRGHNLSTYLWF